MDLDPIADGLCYGDPVLGSLKSAYWGLGGNKGIYHLGLRFPDCLLATTKSVSWASRFALGLQVLHVLVARHGRRRTLVSRLVLGLMGLEFRV